LIFEISTEKGKDQGTFPSDKALVVPNSADSDNLNIKIKDGDRLVG
jgi:hypothetical protein